MTIQFSIAPSLFEGRTLLAIESSTMSIGTEALQSGTGQHILQYTCTRHESVRISIFAGLFLQQNRKKYTTATTTGLHAVS